MTRAMALPDLLAGWCPGAPDVRVTGLALDTRHLHAGDAFVAVRGTRGHGLDYAPQAVASGCRVILHDGTAPVPSVDVPAVRIDGLGSRLGELASRFWGAPSEDLVIAGVTGTNGKTSVAHFLAQAWQREYGAAGLVGTLGHGPFGATGGPDRTTPDAFSLQRVLAECREAGCERVAMEISSHALDQGRCQTIQLDAGIFTNLSHEHLDYHGDMTRYAAAKRRLFTDLAPTFAVINRDDPVGRAWIEELGSDLEVFSYGLEPGAELRGEVLDLEDDGMRLALDGPWGQAEVDLALMGRFNAANVLAVAATLALLGMPWERVTRQLEWLTGVPGRMAPLGGGPGQPIVVVDYAHTPDALEQALAALREHGPGQLVCVFGCGGERDRGKRPRMGATAERLADRVVVTCDNPRGEDPRAIIDDVLAGMSAPGQARIEPDRARAIRDAIAAARSGDIVLVAGKGHEQWQEVGDRRLPFSDVDEVRAALEAAA